MISKVVEKMLGSRKNSYLIPADMVANVSESNHLNHALLVLTKIKYAKIPVLDKKQHIKGLLSLSMITDTMLGLNGIDPSHLTRLTVADVMDKEVPTIHQPYDVEEILHLLVNQPFLVVVDDNNLFKGIITRREVMKEVNYLAHELEKEYDVKPNPGYVKI